MQLPCRRLRRPAARRCRRWPLASCSAPMASRHGVSTQIAGDASPATASASIATTGRLRSGTSASSRRAPRVSEGLPKPPPAVSGCSVRPSKIAVAHPVDPPPTPVDRAAWRIRAHGCIARRSSAMLPIAQLPAPGRRRRKLRLPRPRRIPASCPVSRSGRNGSRPTAPGRPKTAGNIHPAPRRHQRRVSAACLAAPPPLARMPV